LAPGETRQGKTWAQIVCVAGGFQFHFFILEIHFDLSTKKFPQWPKQAAPRHQPSRKWNHGRPLIILVFAGSATIFNKYHL
jgi:hypothetical protein